MYFIIFSLFCCILLENARCTNIRVDPLVDTKLGLIRGLKSSDGQYSMFMGIPYATVDEANPFGPSTPHERFDEVFNAFDDSAFCPQVEEFNNTIVGSLDCLHLNIYVPNAASSQNPLPVLVWIYGGGFKIGFSGRYIYGPSYIVRHDIILVTLNYRLGPYGFMCLNNPKVPGNQGLKDQKLALKWINANIASFGGDVSKITIFGESVGATSVGFHLQYQDEILFDKVIMQSGTSLNPITPNTEPDRTAPQQLSEHLGFATSDEDDALNFLSTVDTKLVIAAFTELNLPSQPCVEKIFGDHIENFITQHPLNKTFPNLQHTPIIVGINNREGLSYMDTILSNQNVFRSFLLEDFNLESEETNEMELLLKHFYVGDDDNINDYTIPSLIDFKSDTKYNYGAVRSMSKYLENGAENVYHYVFSYDGSRNFLKDRTKLNETGAAHADEISYLFDVSYMTDVPTPGDQLIIDRLTAMWTNFVKYGNPTPQTSDLLPVIWSPVTANSLVYIDIDTELAIKQRPFHERMAFMELFYKLLEKQEKGYPNGV